MDVFVPAVVLVATVKALVDAGRRLAAGEAKAVGIQALAWVLGVVVVLVFAQTDWASAIPFGDSNLADLNAWSQAVVGFTLASTAQTVTDTIKAVDNSQSARVVPPTRE